MIKKLLTGTLLCFSVLINAQNFSLSYSFSLTTATSGTVDPTPAPSAVGVTSGSFTAVGTPSLNPNAGNRFSFVGWPLGSIVTGTTSTDIHANMTGSINTSQYYELTLTPQAGYTVSLNTMSFTIQRSSTGIRSYVVRSSEDGYTNNLPASITTNTNLSVVASNEFFWNLDALSSAQNGSTITFTNAPFSSPITLRFYAWNAEQNGGTFSIDNVEIKGSVTDGVTICNSPTITSISGNTPICANQQLNLSALVDGDATITYTWTGAGTLATPNASATAITSAASGDYTLTVANSCGTASAVVTATVNALPTVTVTSAQICAGNTATLTAGGTATSYTWSTSESANSITVTPTGPEDTYTVTGTDANSCSAVAVATVTVYDLPAVSLVLTPSNLYCVSVNTVALSGGAPAGGVYSGTTVNANEFSPASAGTGTFTITYSYTDANGCANTADDVLTVDECTGIVKLNSESFGIYPNPSNGIFVVKSSNLNASINVFDINGKKVIEKTITSFETQIDLSNLSNGVYQLNIVSGNELFNQKLILNK